MSGFDANLFCCARGGLQISSRKNNDLRCTIPGSTSSGLGHKAFAIIGSLALPGSALYPVPVRRPAVSLLDSFTPPLQSDALRYISVAVTSSQEDFHMPGTPSEKAAQICAPLSAQSENRGGGFVGLADIRCLGEPHFWTFCPEVVRSDTPRVHLQTPCCRRLLDRAKLE
jgi:hypothetical protein